MAAPALPEIKDHVGRILLPATELILKAPELTDTQRWLIAKGLLSPPVPRWVSARTGMGEPSEVWQAEQVHWHCYRTIGDPEAEPKRLREWTVENPRVETVARSPTEALVWLCEHWDTDLRRVPSRYWQQGRYDQRTSQEGRWWLAEYHWRELCRGKGIYDAHMLNPRRQLRYHVDAARPADCHTARHHR